MTFRPNAPLARSGIMIMSLVAIVGYRSTTEWGWTKYLNNLISRMRFQKPIPIRSMKHFHALTDLQNRSTGQLSGLNRMIASNAKVTINSPNFWLLRVLWTNNTRSAYHKKNIGQASRQWTQQHHKMTQRWSTSLITLQLDLTVHRCISDPI